MPMNKAFHPFHQILLPVAFASALVFATPISAQEAAPNARDLAAKLSANIQDGSALVRLKLEATPAAGGAKTTLQLQVKSRRTKAATDIIYQVLWPKERKGEAFLLHKSGDNSPTGSVFTLPDSLQPLSASQMKEGIFGSDLTYADLLENFFDWEHQALVGEEIIDRVPCQILESKPGGGDRSIYTKVRSWIDTKRMVPLKVEKYLSSGQLGRQVTTTRVAKDDTDRPVPASVLVQRPGQTSVTELEGSNSKHDVTFTDADFTTEALRKLAPAAAAK
ncbi:MAG: hypothetical protein RL693_2581 [Verrucomicrobiota bacterium]